MRQLLVPGVCAPPEVQIEQLFVACHVHRAAHDVLVVPEVLVAAAPGRMDANSVRHVWFG